VKKQKYIHKVQFDLWLLISVLTFRLNPPTILAWNTNITPVAYKEIYMFYLSKYMLIFYFPVLISVKHLFKNFDRLI